MQCCPARHGALPPHVQAPLEEQPSLEPDAVQSVHIDPAEPHDVVVRVTQLAPLQQPLGQVVASHTQVPPEQRWPGLHGVPPVPHAQLPELVHRSERESHATQAEPLVPHEPTAAVWHVVPEQHPVAQLVGVQVAQACETHGPLQLAQIAPPLPHAAAVPPGWHVPVADVQHPTHDVESQTHIPPEHRCPAAQGDPVPQRQLPDASYVSASVELHAWHDAPAGAHAVRDVGVHVLPLEQHPLGHDVASQMHMPPEQRWPVPHAGLVPHMHAPFVQRSAFVASHATHEAPPVPQPVRLGVA